MAFGPINSRERLILFNNMGSFSSTSKLTKYLVACSSLRLPSAKIACWRSLKEVFDSGFNFSLNISNWRAFTLRCARRFF